MSARSGFGFGHAKLEIPSRHENVAVRYVCICGCMSIGICIMYTYVNKVKFRGEV